MLLIFILVPGLRWRLGVDTSNYIDFFYHEYPSLDKFSFDDYPIEKSPLYVLINSAVKSIDGKFYIVQLVQSSIVNTLIFKYIKKHSCYLFTCLLFYYLLAYIFYSMEIMRGSISISICLFANDYFLERKWVKAYLLYFIALCFHVQTAILFVLPLLFFIRLDTKGITILLVVFVAGYLAQTGFGDYLLLMDLDSLDSGIKSKTIFYARSEGFVGQTKNMNYIIVYILSKFVYGLMSLWYVKKYHSDNSLLRLEPLLMIGLMFFLIQISIQIAYRYADYYLVYFVLFISEAFVGFGKRVGGVFRRPSYVRALLLFFPFIFFTAWIFITNAKRYYPYSSVIDRTIDRDREKMYQLDSNPGARDWEF